MTTTTPVLGQWPRAPLALVLAQVRFDTFLNLSEVAAVFRERIAKEFPRVQTVQRMTWPIGVAVGAPADPPKDPVGAYVFANPENTKSVRLELNVLTYAVTSYVKYEGHFEAELKELVLAVSTSKELFVTRVGLRYVDFIVPMNGASPDDYVQEPCGRSPTIDSALAHTAFNLFDYKMDQGMMRVQYGRGHGCPTLPPDLQSLQLTPVHVMEKDIVGPTAILDTDRWMEPSVSLPAKKIMVLFSTIHADMSAAFRRIITKRALEDWGA